MDFEILLSHEFALNQSLLNSELKLKHIQSLLEWSVRPAETVVTHIHSFKNRTEPAGSAVNRPFTSSGSQKNPIAI